jgi:lysozyme
MVETLEQRLERFEGRRHKRYRDTRGFWSIGIGHNLDADGLGTIPADRDIINVGITDPEIDKLLQWDINRMKTEVEKYLPWYLLTDAPRQMVIMDMAFNMGLGSSTSGHGLLSFTHTLAAIKAGIPDGDYGPAADELATNRHYYAEVKERAVENENLLRFGYTEN